MTGPGLSTIKTLFALSCNTCAYPGCEQRLTDPAWMQVNADIAHIRGEKPGSARYDPDMSEEQRHAYENLLLLCPNCHRLIDRLAADDHPVERLFAIKGKHEERCRDASWASDDVLTHYAMLSISPDRPGGDVRSQRPRLVLERSADGEVTVVNVGEADAHGPAIEPCNEQTRQVLVLADIAPSRLSPGGRWRAGIHAMTMGDKGPHVARLQWRDEAGEEYKGEFPV
jgi:hypothetical protein